MKVNAVVVTYNRLDLLKLTIEKLLDQTYPLNKIVIVDNHSSDGTAEYLKTLSVPNLHILSLEENLGGAGGFHYGIKEAYALGCDYVWIMDDDTIANSDALEKLMESVNILSDRPVGFISSNVLFTDGSPCYMNIPGCCYVWNRFIEDGIIQINNTSFVAMLIPCSVIKDVGLPIKEYFIWGDDGEYSTRISAKYEGYISGKSTVYHYMKENVGVDIFNTPVERISRFYYFYRNWMFTNKIRSRRAMISYVWTNLKFCLKILLSSTPARKKKIFAITKGMWDGLWFKASIESVDGVPFNIASHHNENSIIRKCKSLLRKISPKFYAYIARKHNCANRNQNYAHLLYNRYERQMISSEEKQKFYGECQNKAFVYSESSKGKEFYKLLKNVKIDPVSNQRFFYSIDVFKSWHNSNRLMSNSTFDYGLILRNGLNHFYLKSKGDGHNKKFVNETNLTIDALNLFSDRCITYLTGTSHPNKIFQIECLKNLKSAPAVSFEEAMQRILFYNQIQWQTEHRLVGLGRLDYVLNDLYISDVQSGRLNAAKALDIIKDFLVALHEYYWYKSDALLGDTGQIIILGGKCSDGKYFCNDLTFLFIEAVKTLQNTDPKVLLRVAEHIPEDLMEKSIDCIKTGIGCPLFSNDEKIIPYLIDFGYEKEDAYNYVTSACWEPLIPGIAHEQNNIELINFLLPLQLISEKEGFSQYDTFEKLIEGYCQHLKGHIWFVGTLLDGIFWEKDPFMSAFTTPCTEKYLDISEGGGKYNNYGILSLALSNAVNSLMNIKKYVFEEHRFTLSELDSYRKANYKGHDEVYNLFKNADKPFGQDKQDILELTNLILNQANDAVKLYHNCFGGKAKFGLSSPSYIEVSKNFPASFDGRKNGEPFALHISATGENSYTELMQFASKLDYSDTRFNGNVVDFIVSPSFIENNFKKFSQFIITSLQLGVFQMQLNVVSSDTLIAARNNPSKFPNLIVRVWGFSAYFIELPDEYKDYLIERALQSEHANH